MSEKIRVGILGCAQIAKRSLAPAFLAHPGFELAVIASRAPEKAAAFIAGLPEVKSLERLDYDGLVASPDVDLVYCPLPTGLHYEWVKKALVEGKHVLCEKSLGCSYSEVREMTEVARANRRLLMESFQFRFHAQNLYVKELLARGAIGELRQLLVRFGIPPFSDGAGNIRYHKELGGGALLDNGAYAVKCATYLLGNDIKVLAAVAGGRTSSLGDVDLTGSLMMLARPKYPQGAQPVIVHASYGFDHFYQNGYELWGTEGKIATTRAFTAREDFAAPVVIETRGGRETRTFNDDHFARLLDYVAETIKFGNYEREYAECLNQAKTLEEVRCLAEKPVMPGFGEFE